jgi:hypothetical protein
MPAYRILFESVEKRPTVGAQSDPNAVHNELALEHPVAPMQIRPSGSRREGWLRNPVAVVNFLGQG